MAAESKSSIYERALDLAEAGRYEKALESINEYLKAKPNDGEAWNDTGAILYCLGRVEEAIEYFEKAKGLCNESAEILWNLAQAYLDGGYPSLTARLFDDMERLEILTAELVNKTANAFLQQEYYGNAIEMLLHSLHLWPGQEILRPMIDVIRSKRPKVAVFRGHNSEQAEQVFDFVEQRFMAELHVAESVEKIRPIIQWCDIAWFEGCGELTAEASQLPKSCEMIVRLQADDVYEQWPERVRWENINTLVAGSNLFVRDVPTDKLSDIEKRTRIITIERGVDVKRFGFVDRRRGKRIACVSDINAKSNPMFLLQCMQKLHYLDSDYRLYFAGRFTDKAVEQYAKYIVEAMGLSNVVFFDSRCTNLNSWLRDKHYVVSASIAEPNLAAVLEPMACGLKPVVHNFPGADEFLPAEFLFNLAEDFCGQILSESYEPARYRKIVEERYSHQVRMKAVNEVLMRIEKDIVGRMRRSGEPRTNGMDLNAFGSSGGDTNQWQVPQPGSFTCPRTEPESMETTGTVAQPVRAIPIEPITPKRLNVRFNTGTSSNPRPQVGSGSGFAVDGGSINKVAAHALEASRILADMADKGNTGPQESWDAADTGNIDSRQTRNASLDTSVREEQIAQVASEFSRDVAQGRNKVRRVKVNEVPFGT